MKINNKQKIQPDWWAKTFAGLFLGLTFSVAIGALITQLTLPYVDRSLSPQLGMWIIPWAWLPVFFLAYFIPKGRQALLIYGVANVLIYGCVLALRG